jgi:hypothetical protein
MLFQYSAQNVNIALSGFAPLFLQKFGSSSHTVSGYGEDTFLEIEIDEDAFATTVGSDGVVVRSLVANPLATGTITLQQSSPSNLIFEGLHQIDKSFVGAGLFSFSVTTPLVQSSLVQSGFGTGSTFTATAWIENTANYSFGKESGERAWSMKFVDPVIEGSTLNNLLNIGASTANIVRTVKTMVNTL